MADLDLPLPVPPHFYPCTAGVIGLTSIWSYLTRTIPEIGHLLQPLENIIRLKLIPALTDRASPNDVERNLLALPAIG